MSVRNPIWLQDPEEPDDFGDDEDDFDDDEDDFDDEEGEEDEENEGGWQVAAGLRMPPCPA
jgi:hypothetical protein